MSKIRSLCLCVKTVKKTGKPPHLSAPMPTSTMRLGCHAVRVTNLLQLRHRQRRAHLSRRSRHRCQELAPASGSSTRRRRSVRRRLTRLSVCWTTGSKCATFRTIYSVRRTSAERQRMLCVMMKPLQRHKLNMRHASKPRQSVKLLATRTRCQPLPRSGTMPQRLTDTATKSCYPTEHRLKGITSCMRVVHHPRATTPRHGRRRTVSRWMPMTTA